MKEIRRLKADEIEVRVNQINERGATLLLYKDARVDQRILDEVFSIFGWQRTHQLIGDRLYCTIEIWDEEKGQWVKKQDVGVESMTEKEKGQASDSFKRAGFNVGIGRELYSAPFIYVDSSKIEIRKNAKGKFVTYDKFSVSEIEYADDGEIKKLTIINAKTKKQVYCLGGAASSSAKAGKPETQHRIDFNELREKYLKMTIDELRKEYVAVKTYKGWSDKQRDAVCEMIKKVQEDRDGQN